MNVASVDPGLLVSQAQAQAAAQATSQKAAMSTAQIMNTAHDFESVFATQMMTPMFEGLEVNPMFGGGKGEEMFRTVLLDEYGKQIGQNDSLNMVNQLASAMLKAQEARSQ
jgi:Rod binding domain-containing protein